MSDDRAANIREYNRRMAMRIPRRRRPMPRRGITVDHTTGVHLSPAHFAECFHGIVGLQAKSQGEKP